MGQCNGVGQVARFGKDVIKGVRYAECQECQNGVEVDAAGRFVVHTGCIDGEEF